MINYRDLKARYSISENDKIAIIKTDFSLGLYDKLYNLRENLLKR